MIIKNFIYNLITWNTFLIFHSAEELHPAKQCLSVAGLIVFRLSNCWVVHCWLFFLHQLDLGTALSWVLKLIYLTAMKWNQIQSSSKENIICVAEFCTTRHVPGSEGVWLWSYFPYILLVFGQIRNFLFYHNLRQLRDFLFSLNIHFDWTISAWLVFTWIYHCLRCI